MSDTSVLARPQVRRLYQAALVALLAIAGIAASGGIALEVAARWVQHTREVLRTVGDLQSVLLTSQSEALHTVASRQAVESGSAASVASVESGETPLTAPLLARLIALTSDNAQQQARAERLRSVVATWEAELENVARGAVASPSRALNRQVRDALDEFHAEESALYAQRVARQQHWRIALILALLGALVLVAYALHRVARGASGESRRRAVSEAERDRVRRMLAFALESSPVAMGVLDASDNLILENASWTQLARQADQPLLPLLAAQVAAVRASGSAQVGELTLHTRVAPGNREQATDAPVTPRTGAQGKSVRTLAVTAYPVGASSPDQVGLVLFDLTDQRWLEMQLRHAQRMESLGRLAGGVAHDINNVLTAIIGFTEMAMQGTQQNTPEGVSQINEDLQHVRRAADRAAVMARQLLSFSRQNVLRKRTIDPGEVVSDLEPMLRRIMGSHVQFVVRSEPGVWAVFADPGQIEQVVLNLSINARDAMDGGGQLTVSIANAPATDTASDTANPTVRPLHTDHVRIAVTDTGGGIPEDVLAHIFEPFFTTKSAGKGTGLGLATVQQIVADLGGHIDVQSVVGAGSTFTVWLPRVQAPAEPLRPVVEAKPLPRRRGHVLVAEDDREVRFLTEYVLGEAGFTVHTVRSGRDAVSAIERATVPYDVLVTDLVMPDIGGVALSEHPAVVSRRLPVLFMSGYPSDTYGQHTTVPDHGAFLQKPFTPAALLDAIAELLSTRDPLDTPDARRTP